MLQSDRLEAVPIGESEHPPVFHTKGPNRIQEGPYGGSSGTDRGGDDIPTGYNTFMNFESPRGDEVNQRQFDTVVNWFEEFEDVLYGPEFSDPVIGYRSYIDTASFIDHLLLNNLPKNRDGLQLSTFMYRQDENDRLHLGPIWDFDRAYNSNSFGGGATGSLTWGQEFLWMPRLFEDPDFAQEYVDRYQELRESAFSNDGMFALLDEQAAEITEEVAARNGTTNWSGRIQNMKDWLARRVAALDGLYTPKPGFDSTGGEVSPGFPLQITSSRGTVYYTTDGSDPREPGGGVADNAIILDTAQITIDSTSQVVARALEGDNWSGPTSALFVGDEPPPLRITEIHYNPMGDDDAEFIELQNAGASPLDVTGFRVNLDVGQSDSGYVLPEMSLEPGGRVVLVAGLSAFEATYPDVNSELVLGPFGPDSLSNGGERIQLLDDVGRIILDFAYDDSDLWPAASDGVGASLVLIDVHGTPVAEYGKHYRWRGSTEFGGSPAAASADPIGVVINEVLAHTDLPFTDTDSIELYNESDTAVDISGWHLSDAASDLLKFQIPAGTVLGAGEYVVFDENDFNPTPLTPGPNDFALSGANGDDVWLVIPDGNGGIESFADDVHFRATFNGETLGRVAGHLAPMTRNTLGCGNSNIIVSDVIISEIHYAPESPSAAALAIEPDLGENDLEFIEIATDSGAGANVSGWRLRGGVDFDFEEGTLLDNPLLVVSFDPDSSVNANRLAAFRDGSLRDMGEDIRLEQPDSPPSEDPTFTPYVTVDEFVYDDLAPWPTTTKGTGNSIERLAPVFYGSKGDVWRAAMATRPALTETWMLTAMSTHATSTPCWTQSPRGVPAVITISIAMGSWMKTM
jgi:hypothetical protein